MLVQDAAIIVARTIKKDAVCDFNIAGVTVRKCRHCTGTWKKKELSQHRPDCPVVAAEMILQNNDSFPNMNGYNGIGTEEISRMLIMCVERLGGVVKFDPMQLDCGTGRGLGLSLSKEDRKLEISIINTMGDAE